jgi:hypothetical protein
MNEAEYEDLHNSLKELDNEVYFLSKALSNLKQAAQQVILNREMPIEDLQGAITDLEEALPCDNCLHAPCECPD